jgi:GTPase SAR1 family protein
MICGKLFTDNVLNAVRKFYADSEHGLRTDDEVKIFVLGNGGVGKTQLCRRLRNKGFLDNKRSTSGTHVHSISVALPGHAALVRLNLWDFGGQDIYLGTHHLFLHEQAIFVLMWTPETENGEHEEAGVRTPHRPLVFWLDYIRSLAGADNPVLLVQGKCDRDGDRHSRSVLQVDPNRTNRMINPLQIAQKGNTMSIDPTTTPKRTKLDEMLTHLDATKIVFEEFGYFVALSEDRETIFACPMNADGTPDRDTDEPHLNWIQVTAPEPEFVEKVNSVYGTSFDWKGFAGR